jgi:predicted nucleotidyltransferase
MDLDEALHARRSVTPRHAGLRLLLLHGSHSRGRSHAGSDWDLGYLADGDLDPATLHTDVSRVLGTDAVDLVELSHASALLRFEAASHGRLVHEHPAGTHHQFVLDATLFWCDAEPVIRRAQAAVLAERSAVTAGCAGEHRDPRPPRRI